MEDLSVFKSDLQLIFGMIKCKDDKEKLFNFTKDNESYFSSINNTTIKYGEANFMTYYLKVNREEYYTYRNLQFWIDALTLIPDINVYILCDKKNIKAEYH